MMAHPVREDINWFICRLLQESLREGHSSTQYRSYAPGRATEGYYARTHGDLRTAQPRPPWSCHLRKENFGSAAVAAPLYRCQPRARQGLTVYVPHVLPKARGLGVTVRRRQCKDCRRFRCLCVFWRFAPAGDCPPGQSSLHPIPLFPKVIRIDSTFDVLEEIAACSNDRPFTTAARLNR
jgi:hypothetical protein